MLNADKDHLRDQFSCNIYSYSRDEENNKVQGEIIYFNIAFSLMREQKLFYSKFTIETDVERPAFLLDPGITIPLLLGSAVDRIIPIALLLFQILHERTKTFRLYLIPKSKAETFYNFVMFLKKITILVIAHHSAGKRDRGITESNRFIGFWLNNIYAI